MEVNIYLVSAGLAFLTGSAIAWFVGKGAWNNPSRRSFAIVTELAAIWCLFPIMAAITADGLVNLALVRLVYIAGTLTPAGIVYFMLAVTEEKRTKFKKTVLATAYGISTCFALLSFHPMFITDLIRYAPHFAPVPGNIFHLFVLFYVVACLVSFLVLVQNLAVAESQKKTQLQYVTLASVIAIFSPLFHFSGTYFNWEPFPHDFLFITYSSIIAYAIVKHQLLGIEVIVKRTLVFAGLAGAVVAVVASAAFITQDLLARVVAVPRWFSNVLAAMVIAGVYGPLRNWLVNVTDRYLFQKKYDYRELLRRFTDELVVGIKDLRQLMQTTVNTLADTVRVDSCSLLLLNRDTRRYELAAAKGTNGRQLVCEEQEPFIAFFRETHEPIGLDGELGKVRFPGSVTERLDQLNARLCLPLHLHDELVGVLCLGKKKSDEEYTKDDLDALLTLAKTLAIAIANAQQAEELAKTQAEAAQKEKLAVIGTLSAGINHEICNPLGIVKAQCEAFLLDQEDGILVGKSGPDILERTTSIMRSALKQIDRATAITQKLSNFAKPIKEPTAQPVSVAQEVDEVLLLVGHDLALEKIEVAKEIEPGLPPIVADRRQLQEVLFNLLRNAAQAITPPGRITVRARARDGQVRIEIEDTGSGIAPDKLSKIYDPFFTTKEPGKGTGLGLFIVRQIVERNQGRISVESAVGKGTTFFLEFPAAAAAALA